MNPTRAALLDVIAALGGRIKILTVEDRHGELIGTIQVNRAPAAISSTSSLPHQRQPSPRNSSTSFPSSPPSLPTPQMA
jgi:hypothetical protein